MTLTDRLRAKIDESDIPLRALARRSGVEHFAIYNWYSRRSPRLEADVADAVWKGLTGRALR